MDGILLVDKPAAWTSHDVVARFRSILGQREVGHAGTLDPQATGLLVLALGQATRWLAWMPGGKTYSARVLFGRATDTEDAWGRTTAVAEASGLDPAALRRALEGLVSVTEQVPPMVSALKSGGRRLHEIARSGEEVERKPRPVRVTAVRVTEVVPPEAAFEVDCSAGTDVRTLCVEAGRSLGLPACLSGLRRLASGPFRIEAALAEAEWSRERVAESLLGPALALAHLPALELAEGQASDVAHGRSVPAAGAAAGPCRLERQGRLLGLAEAREEGGTMRAFPKKVFSA